MVNDNLSDYLVKSKYSKVLQTGLYQQKYVAFCVPKGGGLTPDPPPPPPLGAPLITATV